MKELYGYETQEQAIEYDQVCNVHQPSDKNVAIV